MSEKRTVLNCTDSPQPCESCGATVPPNSDHECEMMPAMPENLTPRERAEQIVNQLYVQLAQWRKSLLIADITTALQAQSNADEMRHREKQGALRTLLAEQAKRADAALAREAALRRALEEIQGLDQSYDREGDYSHGLAYGHSEAAEIALAALSAPSPGLEQVRREAQSDWHAAEAKFLDSAPRFAGIVEMREFISDRMRFHHNRAAELRKEGK